MTWACAPWRAGEGQDEEGAGRGGGQVQGGVRGRARGAGELPAGLHACMHVWTHVWPHTHTRSMRVCMSPASGGALAPGGVGTLGPEAWRPRGGHHVTPQACMLAAPAADGKGAAAQNGQMDGRRCAAAHGGGASKACRRPSSGWEPAAAGASGQASAVGDVAWAYGAALMHGAGAAKMLAIRGHAMMAAGFGALHRARGSRCCWLGAGACSGQMQARPHASCSCAAHACGSCRDGQLACSGRSALSGEGEQLAVHGALQPASFA